MIQMIAGVCLCYLQPPTQPSPLIVPGKSCLAAVCALSYCMRLHIHAVDMFPFCADWPTDNAGLYKERWLCSLLSIYKPLHGYRAFKHAKFFINHSHIEFL